MLWLHVQVSSTILSHSLAIRCRCISTCMHVHPDFPYLFHLLFIVAVKHVVLCMCPATPYLIPHLSRYVCINICRYVHLTPFALFCTDVWLCVHVPSISYLVAQLGQKVYMHQYLYAHPPDAFFSAQPFHIAVHIHVCPVWPCMCIPAHLHQKVTSITTSMHFILSVSATLMWSYTFIRYACHPDSPCLPTPFHHCMCIWAPLCGPMCVPATSSHFTFGQKVYMQQ